MNKEVFAQCIKITQKDFFLKMLFRPCILTFGAARNLDIMINDSTDCSQTTSTRICDIDEMMKPLPLI